MGRSAGFLTGIVAFGAAFCLVRPVFAGMPSPLPALTDWARLRLETLSFCLVVLLLSTALIRWLWNALAEDFPRLPRLSYFKALAAVCLWSLGMVVVLTMIAGARELLTPGAWNRDGLLYKLPASEPPAEPIRDAERWAQRRQQLAELGHALEGYASQHEGRYPDLDEVSTIESELWTVPHSAGMRYGYVPGRTEEDREDVLVYEPAVHGARRLVLWCDGRLELLGEARLREVLGE